MPDILLILLFAVLLAMALRTQIDRILPPLMMGSVLLIYCLALVSGSLSLACNVILIAGSVAVLLLYFVKIRRGTLSLAGIGSQFRSFVLTVPFIVYLLTLILICIIYSGHFVFDWDDLSYWGTYAKTLLSIDRIPIALSNCTVDYKDYPPIQQIMQYFFLHRFSGINESGLFMVNVGFLYTLMLPFLGNIDYKKSSKITAVLGIALYLLFPHIFTTQFYYKLGIDYLISVLFGYAIYTLVKERDNKLFCLIVLNIVSSYLALIKTSGVVLSIFITLFYCAYHRNDVKDGTRKSVNAIKNLILTFLPAILFYLSWKFWGKISGNHGYLSDRVSSNVRNFKIDFPDYTVEVILNYIKHIFTHPLTRSGFGITAFVIILLIALIYHFTKPVHEDSDNRRVLHICMCVGLVIFCIAHIYMYLFVFDDWEAHGLLEFDRYINQYLAGIFYFYVSTIASESDQLMQKRKYKFNPAIVLLVVMIGLFPYKNFNTYQIPSNYKAYYESAWKPFADKADKELITAGPLFEQINWSPSEDRKVGLIANAWSDELQFMLFKLVPQPISFVYNSPAIEPGKLADFIISQTNNRNISYIYIMSNSKESHPDEWDSETSTITDNGVPLEEGKMYKVVLDADNNRKLQLLH